MKKLLFIALLLTVVIAGCKKDTQVKVPPSIIGSWEVRASYGGIVGIANYPAGNGNILRFNSDGTYSTYLQFNLNSQGTFQILMPFIITRIKPE
jgi:nitrous oxide reductase accessory protein NosL